jgi:hypothetical protein
LRQTAIESVDFRKGVPSRDDRIERLVRLLAILRSFFIPAGLDQVSIRSRSALDQLSMGIES